jgi:DNA primase
LIDEQDIQRIRDATDMVTLVSEQVVLKQRGRIFWGCCPFHDEKTPSFKVDPVSQLFHCFGCGAGGDAIGFVMRTQNLEFLDAVRYLGERAGIEIKETASSLPRGKKATLLDLCGHSARFYHQELMRSPDEAAAEARAYLSGRQFGSAVAKAWQLGFAPGRTALVKHLNGQGFRAEDIVTANLATKEGNGRLRDRFYGRVMFPIFDLQGRVIAFGGRIVGQGEPKYVNSSDTPLFHKRETLYALDKAKPMITRTATAVVTEGYTDTIAMHAAGFTNTVATLGTALTLQHIKLLNRFANKVIYLFDGDEAGQRAAMRASELITHDITPEAGKFQLELAVSVLPAGMDPADYLARQGAEAMQAVLDGAVPLLSFAIRRALQGATLDTPEQRAAAAKRALTVLLPIRGSILATGYIRDDLVRALGMDYSEVMSLFMSLPRPRAWSTAQPDAQAEAHPGAQTGYRGHSLREATSRASATATNTTTARSDVRGTYARQARRHDSTGAYSDQRNTKGTYSGEGGVDANSAYDPRNSSVAHDSQSDNAPFDGSTENAGISARSQLQAELLSLYIEHPLCRDFLARAFCDITWDNEGYRHMSAALSEADASLPSAEMYKIALASHANAAMLLSGGLSREYNGTPNDHANLVLYMLLELQLQNDIALAKIAYRKAVMSDHGANDPEVAVPSAHVALNSTTDTLAKSSPTSVQSADDLFKEIAHLQAELANVRERLAEIPK